MESIEQVERDLGVEFPIEYKNLVSKHNGLYPVETVFWYEFEGERNDSDFVFLCYGHPRDPESIERTYKREGGHERVIPFGRSGNGNYICFDYRTKSSDPSVLLMIHDLFDAEGKMEIIEVAETFEKFIDQLEEPED